MLKKIETSKLKKQALGCPFIFLKKRSKTDLLCLPTLPSGVRLGVQLVPYWKMVMPVRHPPVPFLSEAPLARISSQTKSLPWAISKPRALRRQENPGAAGHSTRPFLVSRLLVVTPCFACCKLYIYMYIYIYIYLYYTCIFTYPKTGYQTSAAPFPQDLGLEPASTHTPPP